MLRNNLCTDKEFEGFQVGTISLADVTKETLAAQHSTKCELFTSIPPAEKGLQRNVTGSH